MAIVSAMLYFVVPFMLLLLGLIAGGLTERRHLGQLDRREAAARDILITNLKRVPNPETIKQAAMVGGQVVIATDYFKTLVTKLRNLVGGEMKSAQSMMTRARREAVLRMIDECRCMGATEIWNVRFATCNISEVSGKRGAMSVEVYAYGTAVLRG